MGKLELDSLETDKATALQIEIAKEKATALGLAGKRLQESLDRYRHISGHPTSPADEEHLVSEIASNVWALIVQREAMGLAHENMRWLQENFDIPQAAVRNMGKASTGGTVKSSRISRPSREASDPAPLSSVELGARADARIIQET